MIGPCQLHPPCAVGPQRFDAHARFLPACHHRLLYGIGETSYKLEPRATEAAALSWAMRHAGPWPVQAVLPIYWQASRPTDPDDLGRLVMEKGI